MTKSNSDASNDKRLLWDRDAVSSNGQTALDVLVDWLAVEGNYAKYKSGFKGTQNKLLEGGHSKTSILNEIVQLIEKAGLPKHTNSSVEKKITSLVSKFNETIAWCNQTGQGIKNGED
ncbi:hypothetical protein HK096_010347, partial [Nowakowskiella sp. JEL0078]